ncbi:hypothetical protein NQ314_011797 [Rhamnusium bicolor]|uniref:Uncharacterized protein n=1 Tax=Rhamnusium bicolor TaxID=1586634 RepID=A0AAV8XFG9_9CUCU|nr:hypothetical protein NQ314_011797 [Rhamnusium bicolor]
MPYHKPAIQKRRITIYEDPRYTRRAPNHQPPRYADEYIELDVRPGGGHYSRRPPRDYYY